MEEIIQIYWDEKTTRELLIWSHWFRATRKELLKRRSKFRGTDTKLLLSHLCEATTTEVLEQSYWATNTQTYKMELLIEELQMQKLLIQTTNTETTDKEVQ